MFYEDETVQAAYKAIRNYLESKGINLDPSACRIAFGDDEARHTSPILGGTSGNNAKEAREAFVQVHKVEGGYSIQLHRYEPQSMSCHALSDLVRLSKRSLTSDQRQDLTDSIACDLTKEQMTNFISEIENITATKSREIGYR